MAASLSGNVFIVTGSASGMGLATAKTLLARGAMVGLCDVNEPGLQKMVSALEPEQKDRAFAQALDVTSREAVRAFLQTTKKHFGKLDGIANFAGTGGHNLGKETVWETEVQEYDFIMDLNVKAVFNILGEALKPGVLEEPASIVHITSMYAERGYLKGAVFTASKHAANGMIKSAAMEAGDRGIRVNAVMP
jgi:NAD(P)-dependent dehydrogenase (short-subunit alcohol dehydrogenase family)